ncbi:MAG TPA: hypothetical protein VM032_04770, partial [Vicinamibacterales bacterium]|nr:hypothetical protein [Vicinamibacterales bacterium]
EVEVQPGRTRHVVQLLLWVRQRPSHGTRNCVFVTCSQDKPPTWVLSELRRRELHAGYRYELLSKPS